MAGYVRKPLELVFENEEFDGLRVWSRRVSLNRIFQLQQLAEQVSGEEAGNDTKADDSMYHKLTELFAALLPCLLAWNLQEADNPMDDDSPRSDVPLTLDGLCSQDVGFALAIVESLVDASTGVSRPLGDGSPNGGQLATLDDLTAPELSSHTL